MLHLLTQPACQPRPGYVCEPQAPDLSRLTCKAAVCRDVAFLSIRIGNAQVKGLRDKIRAVQEENASYRASNKAAEFEARVQVRSDAHLLLQRGCHPACCALMLGVTRCCTAELSAPVQAF